MALTEYVELDSIVVGHIEEAVEEHEVIAEAEACDLLADGAVSGDLWVAEEREDTLELGIALLGCTDVADEWRLVCDSSGCVDGEELKLARSEKRAWWCVGYLTPLKRAMASRHGIRLKVGEDGSRGKRGLQLVESLAV
jgi:hypothetical protein